MAPSLFRKAKRKQCMLDVLERDQYAVTEEQLEVLCLEIFAHRFKVKLRGLTKKG